MTAASNLFTWEESDQCRLAVDLSQRANKPISRLLFGKFTEHLGRNIYNGMWAQVLRNPGFEKWQFFAKSKDGIRGQYRHLQRPVPQGLLDADPTRVGVWWMPYGRGKVRYTLDKEARNSELCQQIEVGRLDTAVVGVQQPLYLPTHRTNEYQVSLWARSRQCDGKLHVSIATARGRALAASVVDLPGQKWQRVEETLTLDEKIEAGQVLRFRVGIDAPGAIWLDQVFLFPADHVGGFDADVVRLLKESRLPLLRWPGGNFVSGYHWKDGVGPIDDRPTRHNKPWNMPEYNHVGTDEFVAFCRAVGCEPMICLNAGDGTPQEAADWVEYCNGAVDTEFGGQRAANGHPEPYGIRYWEIGNELYGAWQIGHCSADEYAKRYRAFYQAMHAVDPDILFIANGNDPAWNQRVIAEDSDILRSLSLHTLIGGGAREERDAEKVYLALMGYPVHYAGYLARLAKQMSAAGIDPKIALTELQIFTNRPWLPNNGSLTEALWTACLINTCARTGGEVEMITHSALVNHGGGLRKVQEVVFPNPVHHCHQLYSTQSCEWPVPVSAHCPTYDSPRAPGIPTAKNVPYLDCLALTDAGGKALSLFVVNRHPSKDLEVEINVAGWEGGSEARVSTVTGESYMAANQWDAPDRVAIVDTEARVKNGTLKLHSPKHSLQRIELGAEG